MLATPRPLITLTAGDLMSRDLISVSQQTSLREAGRLLLLHQISGMPVVEPGGACVGILSTTDLLRWALQQHGASTPRIAERPYSCIFQLKHQGANGEERVLWTLPLDVCSLQRQNGEDNICNQPHEVLADWQVVNVEQLPTENVGQFMTSDLVTVAVDLPLPELARRMVDAHVHRVIVVDRLHRPVGIVSNTDILAGIARAAG
jgi:CBS domain-containing protein